MGGENKEIHVSRQARDARDNARKRESPFEMKAEGGGEPRRTEASAQRASEKQKASRPGDHSNRIPKAQLCTVGKVRQK